jgi:DNA replication protein DnaC
MAEEEAKQEKKRASRKEQILSGNLMSIPIRFKKAMIEHFESPYDFDLQSSVLITGACGTGKTHLAVALAKQAFLSLNDSNSVFPDNHFYNFQEIIIKVKSSFRDSSESMDKIIAPLLKGFRIIDDIGASKPTDTTIETLYTIVNKRYEDELATIYTTNLSLAEISNVYGDRIASRLSDCRRIVLTGNDRRLKGSNG